MLWHAYVESTLHPDLPPHENADDARILIEILPEVIRAEPTDDPCSWDLVLTSEAEKRLRGNHELELSNEWVTVWIDEGAGI